MNTIWRNIVLWETNCNVKKKNEIYWVSDINNNIGANMRTHFFQVLKSMLAAAFHESEIILFTITNIWTPSLVKGQAMLWVMF